MDIQSRPLLIPRTLVSRAGLEGKKELGTADVDTALGKVKHGTDAFSALHELKRFFADNLGYGTHGNVLVATEAHEKELTSALRKEPEAALELLASARQSPTADVVVALGFLEKEGSAALIGKAFAAICGKQSGFPEAASGVLQRMISKMLTGADTPAARKGELAAQIKLLNPGTPYATALGVGVFGSDASSELRSKKPDTPYWKFPAVGSAAHGTDAVVGPLRDVALAVAGGDIKTRGALLPLQNAIADLAAIGTPSATAALADIAKALVDNNKLGALEPSGTAALWMGVAKLVETARNGRSSFLSEDRPAPRGDTSLPGQVRLPIGDAAVDQLMSLFEQATKSAHTNRSAIEYGAFQNLAGLHAGLRELAGHVADSPALAARTKAILDGMIASGPGSSSTRELAGRYVAAYFVDTPAHAVQLAASYLALGDKDMAKALAQHAASTSIALVMRGGHPPYTPETAPALADALAMLRGLGVQPNDVVPPAPGRSTDAPLDLPASWQAQLQHALPRMENLKRDGTNDAMMRSLRDEVTRWVATTSTMQDARLARFGHKH